MSGLMKKPTGSFRRSIPKLPPVRKYIPDFIIKKLTINQRIKTLRKSLDLTQKEFAQKIYVSTSFQTLIELEKKKVLDRHIKLIVAAFGVSEAWLRTGEGEMFEKDITPDYKITETIGIFKQLNPFFQDFILEQLRKLLEYEKNKT
jgi:transcriptional regulator with XRE-family HTH domain